MSPDFTTETAAFQRELPRLLETSIGQYAAVVGDELIGTFDDAVDAWLAGRKQGGQVLVRQIIPGPQVLMLPFVLEADL